MTDETRARVDQGEQEVLQRAWSMHARHEEDAAEHEFRTAISMAPESVDGYYGLGMTLKALGRKEQAIEAFQKAVELIEAGKIEDRTRSEMLHRLALGHINFLSHGDWDLEKEIWRRGE